jgi:hypothetical protein
MGQNWTGHYCQNFENYLQKCVTLFREGMRKRPWHCFRIAREKAAFSFHVRPPVFLLPELGKGVKGERIKGGAKRRWIGT